MTAGGGGGGGIGGTELTLASITITIKSSSARIRHTDVVAIIFIHTKNAQHGTLPTYILQPTKRGARADTVSPKQNEALEQTQLHRERASTTLTRVQ